VHCGKPAGRGDTVDKLVDDELLVRDIGVFVFESIIGSVVVVLETVVVVVLVVK